MGQDLTFLRRIGTIQPLLPADEAAAIDRCCAGCGVCPWLAFDEPDDPASLFAVVAVLCPRPLPDAVSRGERFAREVGAPSAPLYQYESPEFRTTVFSWERHGGEVLLEVATIQRGAEWLTRLTLRRCRRRPIVALLGRGSDRALQALDDVENETLSDGIKRINVDYLSQCYFTDRECVEAEARAVWPEMRHWADALGVSVVWLTAWSCSGGSGITFRQDDSGTWSDNLVYPN